MVTEQTLAQGGNFGTAWLVLCVAFVAHVGEEVFVFSTFESSRGLLTSYGFESRIHRLLDLVSDHDCTEIVRKVSAVFVPPFASGFLPVVRSTHPSA